MEIEKLPPYDLMQSLKTIIKDYDKVVCCSVYLIAKKDDSIDYDLYLMNINDNTPFMEITRNSLDFDEALEIYSYDTNIKPDGKSIILNMDENEIPDYNILKSKITNGINTSLNGENFEVLANEGKLKGYVINLSYIENNLKKDIMLFSNLSRSHILSSKRPFFSFFSDVNTFKKIERPLIKFNEKIISISFENTMFILNKTYFENLFHYEELINQSAINCLTKIQTMNLIDNFDALNTKALNNKNFKKKLYKISNNPAFANMNYNELKDLKLTYGDKILFTIDDTSRKIVLDETQIITSITQILRILNDESALTIIGQRSIFANEQIPIEN